MTLTEQLYRALLMMPCRCQKRWVDQKPELVTVVTCARCAAIARYELEYMPELDTQ